ncbi:MAG: amidohydrolase family protein, partial [Acidobacteriota bacterium]|nr:amidohydrolase family protein [Acidobacteriota bacterium]
GERLGAELFISGPLFTTAGGHGTEYFRNLPENVRRVLDAEFTRLPKSAEEAKRQVDELKAAGVDAIKAILETGAAGALFTRMDPAILRAVAAEAHAQKLPIAVHTGDSRDVADALSAGADAIEHGSFRDRIPVELFAAMARDGVAYDPTLSVCEGFQQLAAGRADVLGRSLVQQVGPPSLLAGTRKMLNSPESQAMRDRLKNFPIDMDLAKANLLQAWHSGVLLVTGSDAGNPLVIHGPTVHRELALWVEAGIPPAVALQAATAGAAKLLRAGSRFGTIRKGTEANLLVVSGNPLQDIKATEAISFVLLKGEHVDRSDLFSEE